VYVKTIIAILLVKLIGFNMIPGSIELISIASLLVGTVGALQQVEIKKFFAYSSVTHVGFLLAGDLGAF
jgi:NADH:ubiquinone oxidoreductase subunit 2 (subunit N)